MPAKKVAVARRPRAAPLYFASIAVVVSDRRKAEQWYTETLGLDLIDSDDHWVTVGRKGRDGVLHLCQVSEFDTAGALEPGNSGIQLRLPGKDFANACETLAARGVKFSRPAEKADWGWWAAVVDPDGNELMLAPEA
ncbi:MAG: VOC family protein [Thermoplasmata archaeon]